MNRKRPLVADTYNAHGKEYAIMVTDNIYNAMYERPAILNLLPPLNGMQVLDAGCGPGFQTKWMVERGATVTAVDVSETMITLAKARVGDAAQFVQHDLSQPIYFMEDESQDIVLSSLSVHYVLDLHALFSEYRRILKENGRFLFSTGNPILEKEYFKREDYFATELVHDVWRVNEELMEVKYYARPLSAITSALAEAGFWIENIVEPRPTMEAKEMFPEPYEFLNKNPWFMIFQTRKKDETTC